MVTAKVIRISGSSSTDIDDTAALLQDLIDKTSSADLRQLLAKAKAKPSIIKTALKFV